MTKSYRFFLQSDEKDYIIQEIQCRELHGQRSWPNVLAVLLLGNESGSWNMIRVQPEQFFRRYEN